MRHAKCFLVLDAQTVDIIVTGSRSSHLIFSTVRSVTSSCFHNHKLALPLFFFYLPLALSPSCSVSLSALHTDTNIPKCGLTAKATTDFLFNVFQPVAQWHKKHDLLEADVAVCLDVLNFTRFNLFTCCESSNMQSCMETLRVTSCSLAQTKSLERGHRLFMSWAFVLLIHFILTV